MYWLDFHKDGKDAIFTFAVLFSASLETILSPAAETYDR